MKITRPNKALNKLTDVQIDALTTFSNYYKLHSESEHNGEYGMCAWENKLLGYLEALRDCGQITELDRMKIGTYYLTK